VVSLPRMFPRRYFRLSVRLLGIDWDDEQAKTRPSLRGIRYTLALLSMAVRADPQTRRRSATW
jgi:hypothetical protein